MSELSVIATVLFITVSFQSCLAFFSQSYYNNSHALAGDISKRFQVALLINATVRSKNWQAGKLIAYFFHKAVVCKASRLRTRMALR